MEGNSRNRSLGIPGEIPAQPKASLARTSRLQGQFPDYPTALLVSVLEAETDSALRLILPLSDLT
jgi:hypothetical protein